MACQIFTVLYTHQKTKKCKVWQDGILKISLGGGNAALYTDKGQHLDNVFLKGTKLNPGDDFESDRYLITVEAEDVSGDASRASSEVKQHPPMIRNVPKPVGLRPPMSLKRKFTGFQGPREVLTKLCRESEEEQTPCPPTLAQECSSLPSHLFTTTSPLFAAPCRKLEETTTRLNCDAWKMKTVACLNRNVSETLPLSNSSSVFPKIVGDTRAETNKAGGITRNIRSTAQILSLLSFQPPAENTETFAKAKELRSTKCSTDVICPEGSSMKPPHLKSKWDVYLNKTPSSNTSESTYQSECVTDSPGDSQCLIAPDAQARFSKKDDIKNPKDYLNSDNAEISSQSRTLVQPHTFSKTNRQFEQGLLNNISFSDQSLRSVIPAPTIGTVKRFRCSPDSALASKRDCGGEEKKENLASCNNISSIEFSFRNGSPNSKPQIQQCIIGARAVAEIPKAACPPAESDNHELPVQQEMENEGFPEVSFNLMDSFDFDSSDEEDSVVKKLDPHCSLGPPDRCVMPDKSDSIKDLHSNDFEKSNSEESCNKKEMIYPSLPTLNHEDADGSFATEGRYSISNVYQTDHQQETFPFTSTDINSHPVCESNIICTEYPRFNVNANMSSSRSPCPTFSAISYKTDKLCGQGMTILSSNSKTPNTSLEDDALLLPNKEMAGTQIHMCEDVLRSSLPESLPDNGGSVFEDEMDSQTSIPAHNGPLSEERDGDSRENTLSGDGISLLRTLGKHPTALESLSILQSISLKKDCEKNHREQLKEKEVPHRPDLTPLARSDLFQDASPIDKDVCFSPTPHGNILQKLYTAETHPSQMGPVDSGVAEDGGCDNVTVAFQDHPEGPPKSPQLVHPVEFCGHRIEGSASSAVICRPQSCVLEWCETPDRWSHGGLPFESTNGLPSPGTPTIFTLNGNTQLSSDSAEDEVCFKSSSSTDFRQPHWIVDLQESDCDWEFSQLHSTETNEVIPPAQQLPPKVNAPFYLRPRNEDIVDNNSSGCTFSAIHALEDTEVSKPSRLGSRLQKRVPIVSGPDDSSYYGIKQIHDPNETPETSSCGRILLQNTCSGVPTLTGDTEDVFLDLDGNFKPTLVRQSTWAKYESVSHGSLLTDSEDKSENEDLCAQSLFGKEHHAMEDEQNYDRDLVSSACLNLLNKSSCHTRKSTSSRLELLNKCLTNHIPSHAVGRNLYSGSPENGKILPSCDLCFPMRESVLSVKVPKRELRIPIVFQSAADYKQVFTSSLIEHLNITIFELAQRLHKALSKVDMSFYTSPCEGHGEKANSNAPLCLHQQPAKLLMVKKEGPNKGRFFYTCDAPKSDQCKFFKWMEEVKCTNPSSETSNHKIVMGDMKRLSSYVRSQNIALYEESQLIIRKISGFHQRRFGKFKRNVNTDSAFDDVSKTKLYLKLSRKDNSSAYSKDDLWVISKTLNFEPLDTFIACSVFFGPSANNDIEILPLKGYYPSNWPSNMFVHALLVCNASMELTSLRNLQEHFNPSTLPLMPHLLTMSGEPVHSAKKSRGKYNPPSITGKVSRKNKLPKSDFILDLSLRMITQFCLNEDQAATLIQIAQMMMSAAVDGPPEQQVQPVTIIHGVFGAGKSYLLAVVVLFLVQIFEHGDHVEEHGPSAWKILISSSTNVAVDRVLLGLLDLNFDQFIRVGSVRKIAKPILPYSLHAGSDNDSEQLKELLALLKDKLTPIEKAYVRKSIEQHKLGTNKKLLGKVRVVGATCAACPFTCLSNLTFPVVILDECSQMTEPASMLPIARFQCEKLILVGDPKQLSPTIQGSEAAHDFGLEQTIFVRLCMMGHRAILLKTQYRCHPAISAVANELFYGGHLVNGVSEEDRKPLLDWLPTLCFYNANGIEMVEGSNSFHNAEEANFTVKLIQSLIASGIEGSMIGVITLYKAQMYKICTLLSNTDLCDSSEVKAVQVSTVDAFQGAEREIIILSCVRTKQVGFIDSEKRMNVALTRGKRHLLIVGSLACLRKNKLWEHVINHCEKQINGLKHVSQWAEKLNAILTCYEEKKFEDTQAQKMKSKAKTRTANQNEAL